MVDDGVQPWQVLEPAVADVGGASARHFQDVSNGDLGIYRAKYLGDVLIFQFCMLLVGYMVYY